MKKIYDKLVRDKIPEILTEKGISFEVKNISDNGEFIDLLRKKLSEEVDELLEAKEKEEIIGEMADIIEVLKSISGKYDISWEEIEEHRQQKYDERGGFEKGIILISTEEK